MPVKNRIHLILGYACNHHCRYCVQELNGRPPNFTKHVSPVVFESLNAMARSIAPLKLRITFFGGEPLLYLSAIKEVLANVREPNIGRFTQTENSLTKKLSTSSIHGAFDSD